MLNTSYITTQHNRYCIVLAVFIITFFISDVATAQTIPPSQESVNFLDAFLQPFKNGLQTLKLHEHAKNLFWLLAAISLSWTFIQLALKKGDLSDFFTELIKFLMVTSFFWWILEHGPEMVNDITDGLIRAASSGSNVGDKSVDYSKPSAVLKKGVELADVAIQSIADIMNVDIGFNLGKAIMKLVSVVIVLLLAVYAMIIFASLALKIAVLQVGLWFLSYVGIFILGFGGSSFTKEMAVSFYKTVLAQATQMMVLVAIITVGGNIVADFMQKGIMNFAFNLELMQPLIIFLSLYCLMFFADQIPQLISGIIASGGLQTSSAVGVSGAMVGAAAVGAMAAGKMDVNPANAIKSAAEAVGKAAGSATNYAKGLANEAKGTVDTLKNPGGSISNSFKKGFKEKTGDDDKEKEQATPLADQHK